MCVRTRHLLMGGREGRLELEAPAGQRFSQKDTSLKKRENGTTWLRKGDVQRLAPAAFCIREHYD